MINLGWHQEADQILKIGRPPLLMLVGEPGTGKTTYAQSSARKLTNQNAITLSGSPDVEESHLFGRWTLAGSETKFVDGPLPRALKEGRWLIIEEFSQIPIETRACLMPLRDQKEITNPLTGEVIDIPSSFRLVATSNSESLACRKNTGIARVLYDGFFILETPELQDEHIREFLIYENPKLNKRKADRVVKIWRKYRSISKGDESAKSSLSYRAASHLSALLDAGMDEKNAIQIGLINKFLPADADLFSAAKMKLMMEDDGDSLEEV